MKKIICKKCKKLIEGYSEKHVNYMLKQHQLSRKCFENTVSDVVRNKKTKKITGFKNERPMKLSVRFKKN